MCAKKKEESLETTDESFEITEEQKDEIIENVISNFEYFAQFLTIQSVDLTKPPSKELIDQPLILKKHQRELIEFIENTPSKEKIIVKCRQIGCTSVLLAYCLWLLLYSQNQRILFLLPGEEKTKEMVKNLDLMLNDLRTNFSFLVPTGVSITLGGHCTNDQFKNRLSFTTITHKTGRSGTYSLVIADEFAFVDKSIQGLVLSAVRPCSQSLVILSTPYGENNEYFNLVQKANTDGKLFQRTIEDIKIDWFGSEENAQLWLEYLFEGKPQSEINREYRCSFKNSITDTVFEIRPEFFSPSPNVGPCIFSADLGWNDQTFVLFARCYQDKLYIFDEIETNHKTAYEVNSMIEGKRYHLIWGCCDSSGKKTDQSSGQTVHQQLQQGLGLRIYTHKIQKIENFRLVQAEFYRGNLFVDEFKCPKLCQMLRNYEWGKNGTFQHDNYSHCFDSLCYLILNWKLHKPGIGESLQPRSIPQSLFGII